MSVFSLCPCQDALLLDASLAAGDVSQAWAVWSSAGLVLLRLHLLMLIGLVVVLFLVGVWFWVEVVLLLGLLGLVVTRFGKLVAMLPMLMMLLMSLYIGTLLLLPSLICGGDSKP